MRAYQGSCHGVQVQFEIETNLTKAIKCNCTFTFFPKKGALLHRVPQARIKLLSGQVALILFRAEENASGMRRR